MRRHSLAAVLLALLALGQKLAFCAADQYDATAPVATQAPAREPGEPPPSQEPPAARESASPAPVDAVPTPAPLPSTTPTATPEPATMATPEPTPVPTPEPNIALVLPLQSKTYANAAEAARDGFAAAAEGAKPDGALPVKIYATDDTPGSLVEAYGRAVSEGARVVVGPITREGVTALARSGAVTVPTLALNSPDAGVAIPGPLLVLSLSLENESRQMAQIAYGEKHRKPAVVVGSDALSRRMKSAFADEWNRLGGKDLVEVAFSKDPKILAAMRADARAHGVDAVFLALDAASARTVRPYLGAATTYATSRVFRGTGDLSTNLDLKGVHFVDMPWMLMQQAPEIQVYPRSRKPLSIELERFYALGVDAYRIAQSITREGPHGRNFAGVTGALTLDAGNIFARLLPQASFDDNGQVNVGGPMP
jgi:uncharacterized protein